MAKMNDPWNQRFGWYWYGAETIFNWNDEKIDEDARQYKESGITAVILFGTHFRFSYWAYWDDIVNTIGKITDTFHKYDIKVIEHHSSHLTWDYSWKADGAPGKKPPEQHGPEDFPDFTKGSTDNPLPGGARLDDFAQIDGSSGKKALSSYIHTEGKNMDWIFKHYNGNAHCFNHPAYESAYQEHLAKIIATGVDGMMNDDVQWFGGGTACTCEYCRQKFRNETGYELPQPENWSAFYENYDSPVYIAWKKFKKNSSADFHFRLDRFYKSLGFDPIRPAYCAEVLPFDTTCYGFEGGAPLWDYIFQECCGIIRESFVCFAGEAVHRYALASRHHVPSMALMYPSTKDSTYVGWALSRSWGQLFTGTNGSVTALLDKDYRTFEKKNEEFYLAPDKLSDIAFYFSKKTRDYCDHDAPLKFMKPLMSFVESAYLSGIACDMVFEEDDVETLCRHKMIAAVSVEAMDHAELLKLGEYVRRGGTLYVSGIFAEKNDGFQRRELNTALRILGMQSKASPINAKTPVTVTYNGETLEFQNALVHYIFTAAAGTSFARTKDGFCAGVIESVGAGKIIFFPGETGSNPIQPAIWKNPSGKTRVESSQIDTMKEENGRMAALLAGRRISVEGAPDLIPSLYRVKAGMALHLVNTADMVSRTDCLVSVDETLPQFVDTDPDRKLLPALTVTLDGISLGKDTKAFIASPELAQDRELSLSQKGADCYEIAVPADLFSGYALVKLCF